MRLSGTESWYRLVRLRSGRPRRPASGRTPRAGGCGGHLALTNAPLSVGWPYFICGWWFSAARFEALHLSRCAGLYKEGYYSQIYYTNLIGIETISIFPIETKEPKTPSIFRIIHGAINISLEQRPPDLLSSRTSSRREETGLPFPDRADFTSLSSSPKLQRSPLLNKERERAGGP